MRNKSQETLSKYFNIFDKAIITTDDKELIEENNRTKLQEKGYLFIDVDYGKDLDVVRQIIKRRINYYIKNRYNTFSEEQLTNKIYRKLIDETNGNINLMFSILDKTDSILHWKRDQFDMKEDIKDAINEELNNEIEYQKIIKSHKLYL